MLIFSQKFSLFIQATDLKIDMSDSKIHLLWLEQFTRIILLKSTVYEIRIVMFSQASVILSTGGGEGDVRGKGACVVGACTTRGRAWQGACMAGGGHAWQERRPLKRTVRILLECTLVINVKDDLTTS